MLPIGSFREEVENVKIWFSSNNFKTNVGGATKTYNIGGTILNYTYARTICVKYLKILLSSFGEDNFKGKSIHGKAKKSARPYTRTTVDQRKGTQFVIKTS